MTSVPGTRRPATPITTEQSRKNPASEPGKSASPVQPPAADRDQNAADRSRLEGNRAHRSNAQRRREARAARHETQVLGKVASATYASAAFWTSQALISAGLLTPRRTDDDQPGPAEIRAARAQRAETAAEFRAAVAASRLSEGAAQELAESMRRFRDPKGAQEALRAPQKANGAPGATPCPCGCGGRQTARTTPPGHHETASAAPVPGHDGGSPGKAENSVAASTAETPCDLREHPHQNDHENWPEKPDLGEKYEQRNNKLQKRMRLLDEARAITTLFSLKRCGVDAVSGAVAVTQKADGAGGFAGLFRCGSVWSCPECMPVIRADRANLMEMYALAWGMEHDAELCTGDPADKGKTHKGHGMAMATLTSRHGPYAVLEDRQVLDRDGKPVKDENGNPQVRRGQLQRTADGWRRMLQSRWWRKLRKEYGIVGVTRALEVTHSRANAWHTHIHAVVWFEEPVTDDIAKEIETELYVRWQAECKHQGLGRPTRKHGVKVDPARRGAEGAADLARYLVKVQDRDDEKPPGDGPVDRVSRSARPSADQARRLKGARVARDRARAKGDARGQADADSLIADIREEIGQATRARALGNELLRGDNKTGRKDGRTAMELLRLALGGDEESLGLWREYERATKGSRMLTWAGDVRERLERLTGREERDAQDVLAEEDQKQVKAVLVQVVPDPWKTRVAAHPGRRGQVRVAVKVASDHAIETGTDMEDAARAAVRELLESWGLIWGTDMYGPGESLDTTTGELTDGERVVPPQRTPRPRTRWETPEELEGNANALGVTPRDYARPAQAARRAAGRPVARELTTTAADSATTDSTKTLCIVCDTPVNPGLPEPLHLLCDPFTTS
ncbi:hypothetical protein ABZX40_40485 [Streptomyces sp. NPDC004610]|uniref:hypothetical protein n=1 Tax=unclassified Streptomyces TaxID=2593676 RepID=UPI0033A14A5F